MNCATGKGVTVKAKDKRYPTRAIRKLDGKTTSGTRISSSETINPLVTKKRMGNTAGNETFQGCMSVKLVNSVRAPIKSCTKCQYFKRVK